ncbi:Flagellar protein FliS [Lentibacillus sp. JNUCC-1]|uniref:flagellar export chaperone FliS n=1 Tax=Lentibacillus sp. JNUCC-1 TaxID=2654513 RepID=UPI0012E7F5B8|nr:flagellar export chaperone FliS [Lentibacillus sp. JNUCC-1]MUV39063.1 Flagellar protein FliS [Lentibacillus sp. JNUCC-1]
MAYQKKYEAYKTNSVNTASGGELTLMLYNGCIKFIKKAVTDLHNKDYEAKNTNIKKAQDIIHELMLTLDQTIDISKEMLPLYDYILHCLREGNVKNSEEHLQEALSFTTEFRDTWKQVLLQTRQKQYAQGARV